MDYTLQTESQSKYLLSVVSKRCQRRKEVAFVLRKVQMGCRLSKFLATWLPVSPAVWNLASGYVIVRISCWD